MQNNKIIKPYKWNAVFDNEGNCISFFLDDSYLSLLGLKSNLDCLNKDLDWLKYIHPEDVERIKRYNVELFNKHPEGMDYDIEYRMKTKDGYHLFHDYALCTREKDGSLIRCDGVLFDIQDAIIKQNAQDELSNINSRVLVLEDNFESLYDVDLETGKYEVFVKGDFYEEKIVNKLSKTNNYFDDLRKNVEKVIYKEDCEKVINSLSKDFIRDELNNNDHYDFFYRLNSDVGPLWFKIRLVYKDTTKRNVIIGVFDAKEEVAAYFENEKTRKELIAKMSTGESLYIVNPNTEKFHVLMQNEYLRENYHSDETFTESINRYIDNDVFFADRKFARAKLNVKIMAEHLKDNDEYIFRYRDCSSGHSRWYEMRAIKLSEDEILCGFADKDKEIINKLFFNKLKEDYFLIYKIDLDAGLVRVLKNDFNIYRPEGEVVSFEQLILEISESLTGEAKEFFDRIKDIDSLKQSLMYEDKATFTYKSHITGTPFWAALTEIVLSRNEENEPSLLVIGFEKLDQNAGLKEELQSRVNENMDIIGGIASEYTALYHVDLETGRYRNYIATDKVKDATTKLKEYERYVDFFHDFVNSGLVHPDYIEPLKDFYPSDAYLKEALSDKKNVSILFKRKYVDKYLWTEMNIIKVENFDKEAKNVIVGFIEKNEEVLREQEEKRLFEKAEEANNIIKNVVASYQIAYIVNMDSDSFNLLRMDSNIVGYGMKFDSFKDAKEFFLKNTLHPADKMRMDNEMDYETIRAKLEKEKSYSIEYRALINHATIWHEMNITSINDSEIIIAFAVKNIDILKKHLEDKRYDEYFALYAVDVDTQMIQPLINPPFFNIAKIGEAISYEYAIKKLANLLDGEDKDFFIQLSNMDFAKDEISKDDKRTYSFKAKIVDESKWIDMTLYVINRNENGEASMFTLGFTFADTLSTDRHELQVQLKENLQMIDGLASGYHALYYFNVKKQFFKIYHLDQAKFPEVAKIVNSGASPLEAFQKFGNSPLVHPDDRYIFQDYSIPILLKKLAHVKKLTFRFRRNFDGVFLWTEMDIFKYDEIDEEPNVIAIGFAERDSEIRSEEAMNKCYGALTSDMSPKESINSILSTVGEFYGADRAYIFELSQNEMVINNTFEWCADNIKPMILELQDIPLAEVNGWISAFKENGAFVIDSLDETGAYGTSFGRELLEMQGISSLIAAPILNGSEIVGFIGIDNPTKASHNVGILKNVSVIAYSEILKRKESSEEHVTLEKLSDTFVSVYYVDLVNDYIHNWKIDSEYDESFAKVNRYSVAMNMYINTCVSDADKKRCSELANPQYILSEFKTKDKFSVELTDIMAGFERAFIFDFIKISKNGEQFVVSCRDITESIKKEHEQKALLEKARIAAEASNNSKTTFLFNMSHDIRTPMNAITGFTAMAKKYIDDKPRLSEYLNKIDTSGKQLLQLVNQVLEMARIESGKLELERLPINILEQYNSMITILTEQALENGINFMHSLENIKHYDVFADVARMSSITLNIAGNALKYTPRGGSVSFNLKEVSSRKTGYATYVFTVSDTGIGMSEEYLKVLFDPFTREKSSTVSKIQGTGLGMAIVKDLVELLGGKIEVESELGKGTKFEITVDLMINDRKKKSEASKKIKKNLFKGLKVLLVEDNEMNREITRDILEEEGFIVFDASDGTVAIKDLKEKGPNFYDYILMDIQMPIMNGYITTKLIRQMYPEANIPIIALSANAFSEDKAASIKAGMNDHVAKPIDVKILMEVLARYIK